MLLDNYRLRFGQYGCFLLSFIKKAELSGDIRYSLFGSAAEELFCQIINLLLQNFFMLRLLINGLTKRFDKLCLLSQHGFQL